MNGSAIILVMKQEIEFARKIKHARVKTVRRTAYATDKGDHQSAVEFFKASPKNSIFDEVIVSSLCNITRRKLYEYHRRGTGIKAFESEIVCDYNSTRHSRNLLHYHKNDIIEYLLRRKHKSVTLNILLTELELYERRRDKTKSS